MSYVDFYSGRMEEDANSSCCNLIDVAQAGYIEEFKVGDKVWPVFITWLHQEPDKIVKYLPEGQPLTIIEVNTSDEYGFVRVDAPNQGDITLSFKNYVCVPYKVSPAKRGIEPIDLTPYKRRLETPVCDIQELKSTFNKDNVNHPDHYAGEIECKAAMVQQFGVESYKIFCQLNAFKYIWRSNMKHETPDEDLAKANWYLTEYKELSQQAK